MKELSMEAKYIELVESGRKTRTARLEPKANVGEIVSIFNKPYVVTERRIYPFKRLIEETYAEEGFGSPEEFSVALKRIYGDAVYGNYLYSHKFKPYKGEIEAQIAGNGHGACFGCPEKNLYTVPTSFGGEYFCRHGNRCVGWWSNAHKTIELPKRCELYGDDGK